MASGLILIALADIILVSAILYVNADNEKVTSQEYRGEETSKTIKTQVEETRTEEVLAKEDKSKKTIKEVSVETQFEDYVEEYHEPYAEEHIQEMTYGDAGRLEIPNVGISVPLYLSVCNGELHQYYVDMEDSACLFDNRTEGSLSLGISDHWNQGFDGLYDVTPGMTARILYPDGTENDYVCTYVDRNGTNDGYHIIDSQGRQVAYIDSNILYMYTCNSEGWWSVTLSLWNPC